MKYFFVLFFLLKMTSHVSSIAKEPAITTIEPDHHAITGAGPKSTTTSDNLWIWIFLTVGLAATGLLLIIIVMRCWKKRRCPTTQTPPVTLTRIRRLSTSFSA